MMRQLIYYLASVLAEQDNYKKLVALRRARSFEELNNRLRNG